MVLLASERPHAVCVRYPAQGHMNPMLMLAKVLHSKDFHITFVLTEFNYRRLVRAQGPRTIEGLADFRFASIPDGLPYSDEDATQNIPELCESIENCLCPFRGLLAKLNEEASPGGAPPVSCIVSDGAMSFTLDAAAELGIPEIFFWTISACGFLAYLHYQQLVDRGLVPLKEMVETMKKVARLDVELTAEERNLLSVGYKNVIAAKRASWRILSSMEQSEEAKGNEHHIRRIKGYINRVEGELAKVCNEILSIIAIHLLPSSTASESIVFFYKMKGDYYRYMAEFKTKNGRREAADQSLKAYQAATSTAMMDLRPTDSIRLGLALNFSVFYYEILNSPERACHLAKQAFDEAITELNSLSADSYKDSTLIMQLLKDNLTLWTSDLPEESGEQQSKETDMILDS